MNTQISKPQTSIRDWLNSESFKNQIAVALPKICTADRFMRVLLTSIQRTPKLMKCSQASLFQALMTCASLGIEPDNRRAHLIPFDNFKQGTTECQLIVDYKGLLELVKRSGDVSTAYAEKVCENDRFAWRDGDVSHEIDFSQPRGNAYAYYARVRGKDGAFTTVVMTKEEVESIRRRSRAANKGPWVTDFDEMAKKTAFRRLTKWLVLSPEIQMALDEADRNEFSAERQAEVRAGKSLSSILGEATEADGEVVACDGCAVPEDPQSADALPAQAVSVAEQTRAQIEADRAAALEKARAMKERGGLGIIVSDTREDCRPD